MQYHHWLHTVPIIKNVPGCDEGFLRYTKSEKLIPICILHFGSLDMLEKLKNLIIHSMALDNI